MGVNYLEYKHPYAEEGHTLFHWEFLSESRRNMKDRIVLEKSPKRGEELFTFWINQDLVVDEEAFQRILWKATEAQKLFDLSHFNQPKYKKE